MGQVSFQGLQNFLVNEVNLPKFANKIHEQPLRFLKELEKFFVLRMIPEHLKITIIRHDLHGDAQICAELYATDELTYEEFKTIFLGQFLGLGSTE